MLKGSDANKKYILLNIKVDIYELWYKLWISDIKM